MGRPPCCDKVGVKKGPWTPEEDIILVSYIQENGPGNWRSVPTNTGLLRCSKSCRLRWTNYLRPGIKRGNFTDHEEKMIIHLQALLGNRWAAIASYLHQRTDNDIKNYWNTHLKKKLKKLQAGQDGHNTPDGLISSPNTSSSSPQISKGQWERRLQTDIHLAKQALCEALSLHKPHVAESKSSINVIKALNKTTTVSAAAEDSPAATYASNADNIARLLDNWMKKGSSPKSGTDHSTVSSEGTSTPPRHHHHHHHPGFDQSLFSFGSSEGSHGSISAEEATANLVTPETASLFRGESVLSEGAHKGHVASSQAPLTLLEKWLLDDGAPQGHEDLINMTLEDSVSLF